MKKELQIGWWQVIVYDKNQCPKAGFNMGICFKVSGYWYQYFTIAADYEVFE